MKIKVDFATCYNYLCLRRPFSQSKFKSFLSCRSLSFQTMSSHCQRATPPVFNPAEAPFLSREWKEGLLTRPERPVNPFPSMNVNDSQCEVESVHSLIAAFHHLQVAAASDSITTMGTGSSVCSDSGYALVAFYAHSIQMKG